MPKLNLKDEGSDDETRPIGNDFGSTAPPTLRDIGGSRGGGPSPLLQVLIAVIVLGAGTFALNYFGVIHLWGKKPATRVIQTPPPVEIEQPPVAETPVEQTPTPTPTPTEVTPTPTTTPPTPTATPKRQPVAVASMGTGSYTVQVSSWQSRSKADEEVAKLEQAGFPAFIESKNIGGETWYRVRVGKYPTSGEARAEREKLQKMLAGNIWVGRVSAN